MAAKLTKKKAIEISKELWVWLAETGLDKSDWPKWKEYGEMDYNCPLCHYSKVSGSLEWTGCKRCPYYQQFGFCIHLPSPFVRWRDTYSIRARKKYAKLFLEQLAQL